MISSSTANRQISGMSDRAIISRFGVYVGATCWEEELYVPQCQYTTEALMFLLLNLLLWIHDEGRLCAI